MPIHPDYHHLLNGLTDQYCTGEDEETSKTESVEGYPGKTCRKALSVFYGMANERGWDYSKPMPKKESFSWAGSIKEMPGVDNLIRGKALHPLRTVHPEEWPQVREYLEEELEKSAHTLAGKPLLLDHYQVLRGEVLGAEYEDGAIEYVAQLNDPGVMELIRNDVIKHCSVEFEWKSLEQVNGLAPRGINFTGLSLLRLLKPGDPMSSVQVWEGIIKELKEAKNVRREGGTSFAKEQAEPQQFIFYVVRDAADFIPEMFSTTWVDEVNGIQAITGRLREHPDAKTFQALLFMKANNWTLEKMQDWLQSHPQYLRGPAPDQPGIQPASGVTGVMKMSNQIGEESPAKEQGNSENGEREKLRQAQKERAEKYGISPKEGGHLTKPSEYGDMPEDKFADPVNYRYPITEKYVKGALTYFNQPDNRQAGGYTREEAVKIMTNIISAALNAGIEVSWQPEDPVYRDLPEELKKKLTGYEEPSQTATEQRGEEKPPEKPEGPEAVSQVAESKEKPLGEAIIEPIGQSTPSEPSDLVSKREILALIPERRIWRSWSYGPQMLVKQLKHKLEEDKRDG